MAVRTLELDGRMISAREGATVLQAAQEAGVRIPTLCHMQGLSEVGACRLCLVEVAGVSRLQPACLLQPVEGMVVRSDTPKLREMRRAILELAMAERNHVCSVCVANGDCELQALCAELGVDHIRYDMLYPDCEVDLTHSLFGLDHNRCILCSRCVRVCDEVERAHTWDFAGRGLPTRLVCDLNQPWGRSDTCTSCGKCVLACPTGALFREGATGPKERGRLLRILR